MTALDTALPALDVVAIEWPDEQTPCSWGHDGGCSRPAVWWHEHTCGAMAYACEPHRVENDEACDSWGGARCPRCGGDIPVPIAWHPLR